MTGNTRLTTAPSHLTLASPGDTHTHTLPPWGCQPAVLAPTPGGHNSKKRLELPSSWGSGPLGSPGLTRLRDDSSPSPEWKARHGFRCGLGLGRSPAPRPSSLPRPVPGMAPTPQLGPLLTGLADPLNIAAARLDDAAEVPRRGPRGPRVPVHV